MYEILNHTADLAIKVQGRSVKDLFYKCALSLTDLVFGSQKTSAQKESEQITLHFTANNKEELLVEFLGELLFQSTYNYRYFFDFRWKNFTEQEITVDCFFYELSALDLETEIKAVTYHNIDIKQENGNFSVIITFDL